MFCKFGLNFTLTYYYYKQTKYKFIVDGRETDIGICNIKMRFLIRYKLLILCYSQNVKLRSSENGLR